MSAVREKSGQGKIHFLVEIQFWFDYFEGGGALLVAIALVLTFYNFIDYVIIYVFDMVGKIFWLDVYFDISFF